MGAAIAVLSSTILGLAVSTSHCLVGAVVGIGLAEVVMRRGSGQLNTKVRAERPRTQRTQPCTTDVDTSGSPFNAPTRHTVLTWHTASTWRRCS